MNTIQLKDYSKVRLEMVAGGTITPGMILKQGSTGTVVAHNGEGQDVLPYVAIENELAGKEITDNYSSAELVQVWIPQRGDEAYLLLTTGQTVVVGDLLCSAGNGMLKKHTPQSSDYYEATDVTVYGKQIVGQAIEAVTTISAASYIKVRIM